MSDMTEAPHEDTAPPATERPLVAFVIKLYPPKAGAPGQRVSFEGPLDNPLLCYRAIVAGLQAMEMMIQAQRSRCKGETVAIPTATAYTPAYNQADTLKQSVASLRSQTVTFQELCTVEDGGDEDAWKIASHLGVELYHDFAGKGRGLAASCNTAMRGCDTDLLAKIDSDVELAPTWLERCLSYFEDPRVAGVGGRLWEANCSRIADRFRARFLVQHHGSGLKRNPGTLFGANCIFRTDALRRVGGWNEKYRQNYEDVDLSQRLVEAGYLLIYDPKAEARHLKRDTVLSVVDTVWNYNRWPAENQGGFASLDAAAKLIPFRTKIIANWIESALEMGDVGLVYPCLLLFFQAVQRDLQHMVKLEAIDKDAMGNLMVAITDRIEARSH